MIFEKICLVGVGLIGSSIGHAVKKHGLAGHVCGLELTTDLVARAQKTGAVDSATTEPKVALDGANLVILCVPVGAIAAAIQHIAPFMQPNMILSDVGSVKKSVLNDMEKYAPKFARFIPAHPLAGTENSGPESGYATLFQNRYCIITPPENCHEKSLQRVVELWQGMGAMVETMSAEHHDKVLAVTSHLPHLIAYTIVGTAAELEERLKREGISDNDNTIAKGEIIKYSATGFRDFTRIAASDPTMWRDVFLHNGPAVLDFLGRLQEDIAIMSRAIRDKDGEKLYKWFEKTRAIRRSINEMKQDFKDDVK